MADFPRSLVMQSTNNTCWAASTAMILGRATDTEIVQEMMAAFPDSTWNDGATQPELSQVAQQFGMSQVYPVCQDAAGWDQWLTDNGPLLIQVPGNAFHSIVVAGVYVSQDESVEESQFHVYDPWYGERWLPFSQLNSEYELAGTSWSNNVYRR